jgi:hypothetical protein
MVDDSTGVDILVTIGPTCPVETPGADCADKPFVTDLIIEQHSTGKTLGPIRSGADGRTGLGGMEPGEYTIRVARQGGPPTAEPVDFTVRKGRRTPVTVRFDSGIR